MVGPSAVIHEFVQVRLHGLKQVPVDSLYPVRGNTDVAPEFLAVPIRKENDQKACCD